MNVNERAVKAGGDEREFSALLTEYRPFIASCAHRAAGRFVDLHDDEMSVALIAFSEAVRRYRPESGAFLSFLSRVIRSRIIDHRREAARGVNTISLDTCPDRENARKGDAPEARSLVQQPQSRYEDPLKLEIDALTEELKEFGLRFRDVAKCSPKAAKTKLACRTAARRLARDPQLMAEMQRTRQLPAQSLSLSAGVSRKTIGRHRNYIVCVAVILSGEYEALAQYIRE